MSRERIGRDIAGKLTLNSCLAEVTPESENVKTAVDWQLPWFMGHIDDPKANDIDQEPSRADNRSRD